jgi:hypothetical protein
MTRPQLDRAKKLVVADQSVKEGETTTLKVAVGDFK